MSGQEVVFAHVCEDDAMCRVDFLGRTCREFDHQLIARRNLYRTLTCSQRKVPKLHLVNTEYFVG
jgi:hypothetical protein